MQTFPDAPEAIELNIIYPLVRHRGATSPEDEYDVEAIFAECFDFDPDRGGYVQAADKDVFWRSVDRHER